MTDPDRDDPIDFSTLGISRDDAQMTRVVSSAMDRTRAGQSDGDAGVLAGVARWWYPGIAAAAVVMLVAGATMVTTDSTHRGEDEAEVTTQLEEWVRSGHVPDNGDLFATFHGLAR